MLIDFSDVRIRIANGRTLEKSQTPAKSVSCSICAASRVRAIGDRRAQRLLSLSNRAIGRKRRAVRNGASIACHDSIEHDIAQVWKLMNVLVTVDQMRRSIKKRLDDVAQTIDFLRELHSIPRPQDKSAD